VENYYKFGEGVLSTILQAKSIHNSDALGRQSYKLLVAKDDIDLQDAYGCDMCMLS